MWRHGMSMQLIADRRSISRYAVRYHLRNATAKLGIRSSTELRHFTGFPNTSIRGNLAKGDSMAQIPLVLGPIGQVSMLTRSASKAEVWYRDTLALAHIFTFGDLVFFDCGGTRLYLREVPDAEWRPSSILYFLVPEIAQAHAELVSRGIKFQGAPHMIFRDPGTGTEEWMAFFEDPDGNTLAVMSRVAAAA
jgi:catechol 2,3-dioxygenase-like lactoylglutathione lyase family enzyme